MNKALFIDRDGVINSDEGHYYVFKVADFKLNDGIIEGLKLMQHAGFQIILITNQGGVAKGEYTEGDVHQVHEFFIQTMQNNGISIKAIYYCPHHDSVAPCSCRKPKPGMILKGLEEHQIDPAHSYLIGDSKRDIEAGDAAKLKACFQIKKNTSIIPSCKAIIELEKANI